MRLVKLQYWIPATILSGLSLIMCILVGASILSCPKLRSKGFNIFLVFLLLPDVILNLHSLIIYSIELSEDKYLEMISFKGCVYVMCIYGYYLFANMWTSVLICYEVHQLLVNSRNTRRYIPLQTKTAIKRASIPHFLGFLFVFFFFLILPVFGVHTDQNSCWDIRTRETDIVLFIFVCGLNMVIPFFYISYVTLDVYWRNLLPSMGNNRFIASFFLRTTIISAIITAITISATLVRTPHSWKAFIVSINLQGLVVGGLSLMKADVRRAFFSFTTCGIVKEHRNNTFNTSIDSSIAITTNVTTTVIQINYDDDN